MRIEPLEPRCMLAAGLGIGPPILPPGQAMPPGLAALPQPAAPPELPEVARRPEHRLPAAWLDELPLERFQGSLELAEPLIVVGDPDGTPSVTPDTRIDPNLPDSAFAGVVSINANNAEHGSGLCTGSVITPLHILTAAHCVDVAGGERSDGGETGDGTADYEPSEVDIVFNHDGDFANIHWGVAAVDVHPDWHGFNNVLAPGGASIHDDIAVLTLSQPAPEGVPIYPLHFDEFDSAEQIVLAGYGLTGDGINGFIEGSSSFTVKRTGQNVTNTYWLDDGGSGIKEVYLFDFDGPTLATDTLGDGPTLGNDIEVTVGPGDSGGPSFLWVDADGNGEVDPGELVQFGVNAFGLGGGSIPTSPLFGSQAGGMLVSGYREFLEPFLAVMEPPSTRIEIDGSGNLLIFDTEDGGKDDTLLISRQQASLVVHDAEHRIQAGPGASQVDAHTVHVDLQAISGAIHVDTAGGDDALTIDFSGGNPLPGGGLLFVAGDVALQTNYLRLQGYQLDSPGEVSDLVLTRNGANAGQIELASLGTIQYQGVKPVSLLGDAADMVIQVPTDAAHPMLNNDGLAGDPTGPTPNTSALVDVSDSSAGFTEFSNPGSSLTLLPAGEHEMLHVVNLLESGLSSSLSLGTESTTFARLEIGNSIHFDEGQSLSVFSRDTVTINNDAQLLTAGNGGIHIETARNILIGDGARLEVVDGDLTLSANQQDEPTAGNFVGVDLIGAALVTTGSGPITIAGRGGDSGNANIGVRLRNGSTAQSSSSGAQAGMLTIDGAGGHGEAINHGIVVQGAGTQVTSIDGDIQISGQGNGSTSNNHGVQVTAAAVVSSTGTGTEAATITMLGAGGDGGTWGSRGVRIADVGTRVSSVSGAIQISGQGGDGSGASLIGVETVIGAVVASTGTGSDAATITIDGTAGSGTWGLHGVRIADAETKVTSVDGDILITGQGGNGSASDNDGVQVALQAIVSSAGIGSSAATITIAGTGGRGSWGHRGVRLVHAGTRVASIDGDILITGQGGDGADAGSIGVEMVLGAIVASTGTQSDAATIAIDGSGGGGTWGHRGVRIADAGTEVTSVDGNILVTGQGGDGSGSNQYGLELTLDAVISSTGIGTEAAMITISGSGGAGTAVNHGVFLHVGSTITSIDGDIQISGQGNGSTSNNHGVQVTAAAVVSSTGTGAEAATITMLGTGGDGGTWGSRGVRLANPGTRVSSVDGDIQISGQGGFGSETDHFGLEIATQAVVSSTGTGPLAAAIQIVAVGGGTGMLSDRNHGLLAHETGGQISTVDGDIRITGTAGAGNSLGIQLRDQDQLRVTGGADVTLVADSMEILTDDAIDGAGNTVSLRPLTDGGAIGVDIGGTGSATALGLTGAELNRIVAGAIKIGDFTSGAIDITAPVTLTSSPTLQLISGGGIDDGDDGSLTVANLALEAGEAITLDNGSTVQVLAGRVTGEGNPFVFTNNGAVTIGQVGDLDGITTNGGGITVIANSPLTVDSPVVDVGGGQIRLTASPSQAGGDDLTINAPVRSIAADGSVELVAGSNLLIAPGTSEEPTVSTSGAGSLTATAGGGLSLSDNSVAVAAQGNLQVQSPQIDVVFEADDSFRELALGETRDVVLTFELSGQTHTLTITVTGINDPPAAWDATIEAVEDGQPVTTDVLADDVDSDDDSTTLYYTLLTELAEGSIQINGDGTFAFDPGDDFQDLALGETRQLEVEFVATDRHGASSNKGTITVSVTGVNDAPEFLLQPGDSLSATIPQAGPGQLHDGRVTVRDVDVSDEVVVAVSAVATEGPRGELSDDDLMGMISVRPRAAVVAGEVTGQVQWRFDSGDNDFHHLPFGQSLLIRYVLTATDTHGESASQSVMIEIQQTNHPPVITSIETDATAPSPAREGSLVTIWGTFLDADVDDLHSVAIDWGDGAPITVLDSSQVIDRSFSASYTYVAGGIFDVVVTVTDTAAASATASTVAVVSGATIHQRTLWVVGTDGDDRVHLNSQGNGSLRVHADFHLDGPHRTFPLADFDRIIVDLLGGDDHFTTAGNVSAPLLVRSASGDNRVHLAGGRSVVVGGAGNDDIKGGSGRNVLIGGSGSNTIKAGRGGDLLVGGPTDLDDDNDALLDLLDLWNSDRSFADRIDDVIGELTVDRDPLGANTIHGGAGHDLVFAAIDDLLKGNRRTMQVLPSGG